MLESYLCHVRDGLLTRDQAVGRLRDHLGWAIENRDADLAEGTIVRLLAYSARDEEAMIREAFRLDLVDLSMIDLDDVERSLINGDAEFERALRSCEATGIEDTVAELEGWFSFRTDDRTTAFDIWEDDGEDNWSGDTQTPTPMSPTTVRNEQSRVGRNAPCPCGSGKKYKKCCGTR